MLRERPRQHVDQLRQHVEAALPRLDALLLQLLVQRFDDHGHLQGATESVRSCFLPVCVCVCVVRMVDCGVGGADKLAEGLQ